MTPRLLLIPALALLLAGCDIPGLGPDPRIAQREAEGKAIGVACRYALRGIEECYRMNPKSPKTAIFDGWREMDQYMRENKIEGQAPPDEDRADSAASDSKTAEPAKAERTEKTAAKAPAETKPRMPEKKASDAAQGH